MSLRGKQANGLVTQQRVLRAAVAQFLEKGYTGTTTADITGAADPVFLYAAETALQLHIAELSEPLRELCVMAYTLPTTSAYLYRSTAERLQGIVGPYLPGAQPKDFYEMEIASAGIMRSFMAVPCDLYFTIEAKTARFLDCALKLYNVPAERRQLPARRHDDPRGGGGHARPRAQERERNGH